MVVVHVPANDFKIIPRRKKFSDTKSLRSEGPFSDKQTETIDPLYSGRFFIGEIFPYTSFCLDKHT